MITFFLDAAGNALMTPAGLLIAMPWRSLCAVKELPEAVVQAASTYEPASSVAPGWSPPLQVGGADGEHGILRTPTSWLFAYRL